MKQEVQWKKKKDCLQLIGWRNVCVKYMAGGLRGGVKKCEFLMMSSVKEIHFRGEKKAVF